MWLIVSVQMSAEVLPHEMADLYVPQGVDLGGVAPPQEKWNDTVWKVA